MGVYGNSGATPEGCDCCGIGAKDCGMIDDGWITRDARSDFPGIYCIPCASLLRLVLWSEQCADCGMVADSESAAERDGWRYFADDLGNSCRSVRSVLLSFFPLPRVVRPAMTRRNSSVGRETGVEQETKASRPVALRLGSLERAWIGKNDADGYLPLRSRIW